MKHSNLLLLILLFVFSFSCNNSHHDNSKTLTTASTETKIEVIDFYGTHRCVTCKAIEANAKYTVETYFEEAMKDGSLSFFTVNVDDEANYDMAERFETVGTALFINVIKEGKEEHIDLTSFAFAKGTDKEVFSAELKVKIEEQLATL